MLHKLETVWSRVYRWDAKSDARLLQLRNQGYSFARIAEIMGIPSKKVALRRWNKLNVDNTPSSRRSSPFSEEERTQFIQLYTMTPPIPVREIARRMGRTIGSIVGFRMRLKITPRARIAVPGKPNQPKKRSDGKPRAPKVAAQPTDFIQAQKNLEDASKVGFPNGGKTFADLTPRCCRFMAGDPITPDHKFCGARVVEGKSWCPSHYRVVFRVR